MSYQPIPGAGTSVAATTSAAQAALPAPGIAASILYVFNSGTVPAFVRWSSSTAAQNATLIDQAIPPGVGVFLAKNRAADTVSAITASGTATVYFCGCDGPGY